MTTPEYLTSLRALVTLGTPLMKVPDKVETTIDLQCALNALHVALLRVEVAVMTQQLDRNPKSS